MNSYGRVKNRTILRTTSFWAQRKQCALFLTGQYRKPANTPKCLIELVCMYIAL